jgi:hypothetical protein
MFEACIVGVVVLFGAIVALVSAEGLMLVGGIFVAVGFVGGVPAAFIYHLKLFRALRRNGDVPKRWWLAPMKHHEAAGDEARDSFAWAWRMGAVGFVVIVLGCFLVAVGLWKLRSQEG